MSNVSNFKENPRFSGVRVAVTGGTSGLGLSLVRVVAIEPGALRVAGIDCVDGTPVYDVKPYLPWCEAQPDAKADWAGSPPAVSGAEDVAVSAAFAVSIMIGVFSVRVSRRKRRQSSIPLIPGSIKSRIISDGRFFSSRASRNPFSPDSAITGRKPSRLKL